MNGSAQPRRTDRWVDDQADQIRDAVALVGDELPDYHAKELRGHANVALDLLVDEIKRFPTVKDAPFVATTTFCVWFRDTTFERNHGEWRLWSDKHVEIAHAEDAAAECMRGREAWAETRIARDTRTIEWLS